MQHLYAQLTPLWLAVLGDPCGFLVVLTKFCSKDFLTTPYSNIYLPQHYSDYIQFLIFESLTLVPADLTRKTH